jgi:hypothetical protein
MVTLGHSCEKAEMAAIDYRGGFFAYARIARERATGKPRRDSIFVANLPFLTWPYDRLDKATILDVGACRVAHDDHALLFIRNSSDGSAMCAFYHQVNNDLN